MLATCQESWQNHVWFGAMLANLFSEHNTRIACNMETYVRPIRLSLFCILVYPYVMLSHHQAARGISAIV